MIWAWTDWSRAASLKEFETPHKGALVKLSYCLVVGLCLALVPQAVRAQSCTQDTDCDPEDYCDLYPSGTDSSEGAPGSEGGIPEEEPVTEPEPVDGQCEPGGRDCTSDDECLEDHYCALNEVDVACPEGMECEPPPPSGRCEHEPYVCDANSDCPEPAVCGEDGECVFQIEICQTDAECDDEYECISVRGGSSDSTSRDDSEAPAMPVPDDVAVESDASASSNSSEEDGSDPKANISTPDGTNQPTPTDASEPGAPGATDADVAEDVAEDDEEPDEDFGLCFPKLVPCDSNDDCIDGWICAEIDDGPPGWDDVERACLPPGIDAALSGDLDVDDGGEGESTSSSDDGAGEGVDLEDGEQDPAEDVETALGTQGGSEGSAPSDGCALRAPSSQRGAVTWVLVLALGLFISMRRAALLS